MLVSKDKNHFRVDTLQLNAPRWQLCDNQRHCWLWISGSRKCHLIGSPVKLPVLWTVLFCLIPLDVAFASVSVLLASSGVNWSALTGPSF